VLVRCRCFVEFGERLDSRTSENELRVINQLALIRSKGNKNVRLSDTRSSPRSGLRTPPRSNDPLCLPFHDHRGPTPTMSSHQNGVGVDFPEKSRELLPEATAEGAPRQKSAGRRDDAGRNRQGEIGVRLSDAFLRQIEPERELIEHPRHGINRRTVSRRRAVEGALQPALRSRPDLIAFLHSTPAADGGDGNAVGRNEGDRGKSLERAREREGGEGGGGGREGRRGMKLHGNCGVASG